MYQGLLWLNFANSSPLVFFLSKMTYHKDYQNVANDSEQANKNLKGQW